METYLDIETIPGEACKQEFLDKAVEEFKAPSDLTKGQAAEDLGMDDPKEIKFTAKDAIIKLWEDEFRDVMAHDIALEKWKKTSFDGSKGELASIGWAVENDDAKCLVRGRGTDDESYLLETFFNRLESALKDRPPFFIGHYVAGFDLKFLFHRAVILGIHPPFNLPFAGRHSVDFYDNMAAWCGYKDRISQDNLCKALGIEGKPEGIDGSKVYDYWEAGKYNEIQAYNIDDVEKSRLIHKLLNFRVIEE